MKLRGPMSPPDRTQVLIPRALSSAERVALREQLLLELPRIRRLVEAAEGALDGPDPDAALVMLGFLVARASALLFPL